MQKDLEYSKAQAPAHSLREHAVAETLHLVVNTDAFASQKLYDLTSLGPNAGRLSHVRYANMLSLKPLHQAEAPDALLRRAPPDLESTQWVLSRSGGHSTRETPDPIPNSAVKPRRANGTASQDVGE